MTNYTTVSGLRVATILHDLIANEIAPGTGVAPDAVWNLLTEIVRDLGPRNAALLARRDEFQSQIDSWLAARDSVDPAESRAFLEQIGYIVPEGDDFEVTTASVDPEITTIAGPQLVVPVDNARYVLNAANARWGSLFDALYGTDILSEGPGTKKGDAYNPARGELVIARANDLLDGVVPLAAASWAEVRAFTIEDGTLRLTLAPSASGTRGEGETVGLATPEEFVGYVDALGAPSSILLRHNGLHIDLLIDPTDDVGRAHPAGIKDIILEAAVSTIVDCEDSVSAVDAEDKANVYANWNGLMKGDLTSSFTRDGEIVQRSLNPDRTYTATDGSTLTLHGRSLLLTRHVGAHVTTDAVTTEDGAEIAETFLDAVVTALAAIHDLRGPGAGRNSLAGSVYIVKPKQHGPDEVALAVDLFARIEAAYGLPPATLKIGIMDEERRTTVNLKECIRVAADRVIFINTGFLDRTGDEIHTHMEAGPIIPKSEIKAAPWMVAYEDWNVDIGLETGLPGHAQIGKGMWAMPSEAKAMLEAKISHPQAGANCAWVPSPTLATIHAIHYHQVNVPDRQRVLADRSRANIEHILTPPLLGDRTLTPEEIQADLDNNAQSILGYVARWVEQGVGCSTVPDIKDIGLMEDRATLRISSQHIANWINHGLVTEPQVGEAMHRMAEVVDRQNAGDNAYNPMAPSFKASAAFRAAMDLVRKGREQPNGYTEALLWQHRRTFKSKSN
jgi:malate synthase